MDDTRTSNIAPKTVCNNAVCPFKHICEGISKIDETKEWSEIQGLLGESGVETIINRIFNQNFKQASLGGDKNMQVYYEDQEKRYLKRIINFSPSNAKGFAKEILFVRAFEILFRDLYGGSDANQSQVFYDGSSLEISMPSSGLSFFSLIKKAKNDKSQKKLVLEILDKAELVLEWVELYFEAHGYCFTHNDLHPNNITYLIDRDDVQVRFIDFGHSYINKTNGEPCKSDTFQKQDRFTTLKIEQTGGRLIPHLPLLKQKVQYPMYDWVFVEHLRNHIGDNNTTTQKYDRTLRERKFPIKTAMEIKNHAKMEGTNLNLNY